MWLTCAGLGQGTDHLAGGSGVGGGWWVTWAGLRGFSFCFLLVTVGPGGAPLQQLPSPQRHREPLPLRPLGELTGDPHLQNTLKGFSTLSEKNQIRLTRC